LSDGPQINERFLGSAMALLAVTAVLKSSPMN
jgi:hypothetical protein